MAKMTIQQDCYFIRNAMPPSWLTKCYLNTAKITDTFHEDMEHINPQIPKKSIIIILVASKLALRKTVKAAGIVEKYSMTSAKTVTHSS